MEFVTYSESSGFNIIKANNMEEARLKEEKDDTIVLDNVKEIDSVIIDRIRGLIN